MCRKIDSTLESVRIAGVRAVVRFSYCTVAEPELGIHVHTRIFQIPIQLILNFVFWSNLRSKFLGCSGHKEPGGVATASRDAALRFE